MNSSVRAYNRRLLKKGLRVLPLRYRRAYQYILEHLENRDLSVREVATHVDVTERALQMAFRTHLGMTPAELIRRRRIERIRKEPPA